MQGELVGSGKDAVPEQLQEALGTLTVDTRGEQRGVTGQLNPQLRKRQYNEAEIAARKRNRRDIRAAAESADAQ
jgi:hypothetical protein